MCVCEYTLLSSSLSSSEAKNDGRAGLQKLDSESGRLLLTDASLVRTVAGGRDCSDSRPTGGDLKEGREERMHSLNSYHDLTCQIETMEWCEMIKSLSWTGLHSVHRLAKQDLLYLGNINVFCVILLKAAEF